MKPYIYKVVYFTPLLVIRAMIAYVCMYFLERSIHNIWLQAVR